MQPCRCVRLHDIGDVDGDGEAFRYTYTVTDIYGSEIDITDKVRNPLGTIVDIKLADVEKARYTGEALVPKVVYGEKTLVEGDDYIWTRNSGDGPIVLPGDYGVTIIGCGDFTGMMITTFTVRPTAEDMFAAFEATDTITAELAKVNMDALDAGDANALAAVDTALATYNALTEAQKTQISSSLVMTLLSVSQRAAAAKIATAAASANRIDLSGAKVSVAAATYTGKKLKPKVSVVLNGVKLKAGANYEVTYANNKNVGTGVAVVKGIGSYAGAAIKTFKIVKAKNTLTVKAKTAKVKLSKVKKANVKLNADKAVSVSKAVGKITYKKAEGNKKITIAKNGRITVKKGIKGGTYNVKVKVTAAGDTNHKKRTKAVTFKVKVI